MGTMRVLFDIALAAVAIGSTARLPQLTSTAPSR
jgi:hypothetical protein